MPVPARILANTPRRSRLRHSPPVLRRSCSTARGIRMPRSATDLAPPVLPCSATVPARTGLLRRRGFAADGIDAVHAQHRQHALAAAIAQAHGVAVAGHARIQASPRDVGRQGGPVSRSITSSVTRLPAWRRGGEQAKTSRRTDAWRFSDEGAECQRAPGRMGFTAAPSTLDLGSSHPIRPPGEAGIQ